MTVASFASFTHDHLSPQHPTLTSGGSSSLRRARSRRLRYAVHPRRHPHHRIHRPTRLLENAPNDESNPHTFNFGLESGEVINPEIGGNEARWINHCCDPNCEAIEEDDRIFIYALRDIEAGQELFYDYAMEIDEPITNKLKNEFRCHCGAARCRGTMLSL